MNDHRSDSDIDADYLYSRATYYRLIDKGSEALEDMMAIAKSSEHPRAYEVIAGLMKNLADINGELMNLQKKRKDALELKHAADQIEDGTTTNVYIGSTSDLQKMLLEQQMKDVTPDNDS